MKKGILLAAIVTAFVLSSSAASAQTASDSITVTAANVGIFTFNIVQGSFAFGNVDASGTLIAGTGAGVAAGGRNGTNTGGIYNAVGASDWTANSAPPRTVRVFNASTTAVIGWGVADRLGMQVPTTGTPAGSASCGFKAFGTVGDGGAAACGSGNLIRNVTVGNGASAISAGKLDLRLDVLDTDVAGSNTWTVLLTASGT